MISALFPGSFDPPTYGHLNIIERARTIFSEIHVVIAVNSAKNYLFSAQEREQMLKKIVEPWFHLYLSQNGSATDERRLLAYISIGTYE